jgi:hypothetical protein
MTKLTKYLGLLLLLVVPATASAQDDRGPAPFTTGLKLRGSFHFNSSTVDVGSPDFSQPEAGYGAGLEINGRNLGFALYGYTPGQTRSFDSQNTPVIVVLEGNYFVPIQRIRVAPYLGTHTSLGVFTKDYFSDAFFPRPQDGLRHLGYQAGVRFKPIPLVGLDLQWRRQSAAAAQAAPEFERSQFMAGLTIF